MRFLDSNGLLYFWSKIIAKISDKLDKSGGVMTGAITLSDDPTTDMQAATKRYVDNSIVNAGGGDMIRSVYDTNGNGIVDNAEKVSGFTVATNVPADAKFTDTTYDEASSIKAGLMSAADFSKLADFASAGNYVLKSDVSNTYRYKGSVVNYNALPIADNTVGDVWNTEDTGMNYGWTGVEWDALGSALTVDSITNADIDTITA